MKQRKQEQKAREGTGDNPADVNIPDGMFKEPGSDSKGNSTSTALVVSGDVKDITPNVDSTLE